ncbi:PhnD/SsuA/transferrin family substrate-binding protein [Bradyrhizobium sp. BR 1432]|uniref:PhnD/SsuA/transferrin family substrate-binding protein n=1 Tax=Bradyrhizobium sp. BR 1432 TaxID=3447966 RepID=UPI003EE5BF81
MSQTIWVGAVAYDPKVVSIWEGMRRYFHEEAHLAVEVVLFQSYEAQVAALLALPGERLPRIDIAWNTNLAYIQADAWSDKRCRPIAMRDTDVGWMTKIVAVTGGPVATLGDLKNRTLALGSRDSGHAAILPVYFLEREGLIEGKTTERCASTRTSVSTVTPGRASPTSFARCSTAAPMPAQSAAHSGTRCERSVWCRGCADRNLDLAAI